ncbi:MAG: class I SAM-dependent methyltransferase [Kiritimatiellales bacterium]|nr:class I SAM-dependent methyltransferase [Kiritimatiellales bacterium]
MIRSFFIATFYDAFMRGCERRCLGEWRRELLAEVSGDVLEIGGGTGVNLQYYPKTLRRLVLTEPDPNMRQQLQKSGMTVADFRAEKIDLPDESFDCIVSTLVLCSVDSQAAALNEAFRLIRPGGSLYFIEHVVAPNNEKLARWQKRLEPIWLWVSRNCHLSMDTARAIREAGFEFIRFDAVSMIGAPSIVRSVIKGVARKPNCRQSLLEGNS